MARTSGRQPPISDANFKAGNRNFRIASGRLVFSTGSASIDYFIGSGTSGRSYLTSRDGFLFELPVSWYSGLKTWDSSPGFEDEPEVKMNRAVDPTCLSCHASRLQPIWGTLNRYADPPFLEDGVSCERCHGPGGEHVRNPGAAHMVNPASLPVPKRDSVCAQCHLTGDARIERPGRHFAEYRAGANLADFVSYFVWASKSPDMKVTSHVENLAMSGCKRGAGDALWCGTCHDPHTGANRTQSACVSCHPSAHHQDEACAECHMPHSQSADVAHGVTTDHSIPRDARRAIAAPGKSELRAFLGLQDNRSLGLAYAEVGDSRARRYLAMATPADPPVLIRLAELETNSERAAQLYQQALQSEPLNIVALVNLGVLCGGAGRFTEAASLWKRALEINPALEPAALDLAKISRPEQARAILQRYLAFNPDSTKATAQLSSLPK